MAGIGRAWLMERLCRSGPLLALMLFALLAGLALGLAAPQSVDGETLSRTRAMVGHYIQTLPETGVSSGEEFGRALALNGAFAAALALSGLSLLGLPLAAVILFTKGLSLGYAMSFLLDYQGASGFVVIFLSMLPQNLLLLPVLALAAVTAALFSLSLFSARPVLGAALGLYSLRFAAFMGLVALAAIIQAYVCPLLLKIFFIII